VASKGFCNKLRFRNNFVSNLSSGKTLIAPFKFRNISLLPKVLWFGPRIIIRNFKQSNLFALIIALTTFRFLRFHKRQFFPLNVICKKFGEPVTKDRAFSFYIRNGFGNSFRHTSSKIISCTQQIIIIIIIIEVTIPSDRNVPQKEKYQGRKKTCDKRT
jgi:hypothetical protein